MPSGAFLANASYNIKNFIWHAKHEEPCISPTLETSTFACTSCQRQQLQGTRSADKDYITDKPRLSDHRTNPSNLTDVTISDMPLCSGRFFDIYVGEWSGRSVCFKVVRLPRVSSIKISSSEVDRWRQLSHPNILPFYGIYQNDKQVSLASPWMKKGDITEYLKHDQTSDRVHFFDDVAQGLKYLHENGIVHGDLKGKNVLVNEDGRAVLADFGTSSVIDADVLARVSSPSSVSQGTARWRAPETFNFEGDDELPDT
ncbi:Serine/threonine-protein kinase HT1, partial [Termitomyces sp. T112]